MKTLRIKLKIAFATTDGRAWEAGAEVDWEFHDALRMIERGAAERVEAGRSK